MIEEDFGRMKNLSKELTLGEWNSGRSREQICDSQILHKVKENIY